MAIFLWLAGSFIAALAGFSLIRTLAFIVIDGYLDIHITELVKIRESRDWSKLRRLILDGVSDKARLLNYRQLRFLEKLEAISGEDLSLIKKFVQAEVDRPQEVTIISVPPVEIGFSPQCEPALIEEWKSLCKERALFWFIADYLLPLVLPSVRIRKA